MEARHRLSGLSPLVPGHERRRDRRPPGHPPAPRLPGMARGRRGVDVADLHLAHGRFRLRRRRLLRHRPDVRHARRFRRPRGRGAWARPQGHPRFRAEPHLGPAPLVPREPLVAHEPEAGLVHLAGPGTERRPAQQLGQQFRRPGLDLRRGLGTVLLPRLPAGAAGPQLAQPRGPPGDVRRPPVLARPRRRRVPRRRDLAPDQGRRFPGQPAEPRLPAEPGRDQPLPPGLFGGPAGGARGGRRDAPGAGGISRSACSSARSTCPSSAS